MTRATPTQSLCPLCRGEQSDLRFDSSALFRHVSCRACGLVYVSPLPAELEALNADLYGCSTAHGGVEPGAVQRPLPRRHLRELVFLGRRRGEGALLDVGCGVGRFLLAARERGWRACGVELCEASARVAQSAGLDVRATTLKAAGFDAGCFDAARLNQVIEHVSDPLDLLREVARVLRPGGVLSLGTPNVASLSARLLGARWHHLGREGNGHVVLFARDTLSSALAETGFRPLRWRTTGLRLSPRKAGLAGRLTRASARLLTPLAEVAGRGGRMHVFAERTDWA